mgnify:CR=1 FL=1
MIAIDNKLISEQVIEEQFVCDLSKCKGGCCEDGDAGAPMENWELEKLKENYELIKPYMTEEGMKEIERQGKVIHVMAKRLFDRSEMIRGIEFSSRDFH